MASESLSHMEKKDSTVKWFVFGIIPFLNLYWLWKAAEVVSGHEKYILEKYEALEHSGKKESTGKWFGIFLCPVILGVLPALAVFVGVVTAIFGGGTTAAFVGEIFVVVALGVPAFIVGIYVLYKMAVCVSGHEKWYPEKYEVVKHKEKRGSIAKWVVFGIIPILNLYFLWKMGEVISGHERVYK